MYNKLVDNYKNGDKDIDIIGFSRGAALAREFANMIYERGILDTVHEKTGRISYWSGKEFTKSSSVLLDEKPDIRFVGLFDTVGSFGIPGNDINIGVRMDLPPNVLNAAHAISGDERRNEFPLTRLNKPLAGQNFVEKVFDGDHSDIGGGHLDDTNLLSKAPLNFIYDEAVKAKVPLEKIPSRPWPYKQNTVPHDLTTKLLYTDGGQRSNLP